MGTHVTDVSDYDVAVFTTNVGGGDLYTNPNKKSKKKNQKGKAQQSARVHEAPAEHHAGDKQALSVGKAVTAKDDEVAPPELPARSPRSLPVMMAQQGGGSQVSLMSVAEFDPQATPRMPVYVDPCLAPHMPATYARVH
jgi:hypothetical protein